MNGMGMLGCAVMNEYQCWITETDFQVASWLMQLFDGLDIGSIGGEKLVWKICCLSSMANVWWILAVTGGGVWNRGQRGGEGVLRCWWVAPIFGLIAPRSTPNSSSSPQNSSPSCPTSTPSFLPESGQKKDGRPSYCDYASMTPSVVLHRGSWASISGCPSDVSACLSVCLKENLYYFLFFFANRLLSRWRI